MNGLGGLNKSPEGVVIGLVQLQLPVVATKEDLCWTLCSYAVHQAFYPVLQGSTVQQKSF